jgi:prolyl oligopeptidase
MRFKALTGFVLMASLQAGCGGSGHHDNNHGATPIAYPVTKRDDVVENYFGKAIADPYRWLENDPQKDNDVVGWIEAQRRTSSAYLDALPGRDAFRKSLKSAFDYERVSAPQKVGSSYFYTRKNGEQNQAALYVRDRANGDDRLLIDPAEWSDDGSVAFPEWSASPNGAHVAYAVQEGGSDWRTIRVLDVATGQPLADEVKWARLTQIAWTKDGSGFYYSRYPEPNGSAGLSNHAAYFHRVGTAQTQDELFYATPEHPGRMNSVGVTSDGRYAIVYSSPDLVHAAVTVVDLDSSDRVPRKLIENPDHVWSFFANVGTKLYLITDTDAERLKIVTVDLAAPEPVFADLIPQQEGAMTGAYLVGSRLLVSYLVDAKSEMRRYTLDGTPDGVITFPGIGSVKELTGDAQDSEAFVQFESFNQPKTVYRYDVSTNTSDVWVEPNLEADLRQIIVDQVFYASKDGTRIPMFVARRKDVSGPAPTVLMGYGAFATNMTPAYSPMLTGWLLQGGVVAIPAIRGGGEYGAPWSGAGRREKK